MRKIILLLFFTFSFITLYQNLFAQPNKVEIKSDGNKCVLYVNGKPFFIKGAGYRGFTPKEVTEKYFQLAKEMGANSIRQWGAAPNENEILDLAHDYGLMVNLGIWLTWNISYKDTTENQKEEILEYIKKYKDHPAILMWNLGNENIVKIKSEDERIAYAKYIEDLCKKIRRIDPNHPICVTDLVAEGIPYLKYMPSVDIYGFNAYKAIEIAEEYAKIYGLDRPYIYSEFGPDGSWEVKLDENGIPAEPDNFKKAEQYAKRWERYIKNVKNCLGGYAFLLDGKYEETKTWWGITHEGLRTPSFWALKKVFTDTENSYKLPRITNINISKTIAIQPSSKITVTIFAEGEDISYQFDAPKFSGACWTQDNNIFIYQVPSSPGVYVIYGIIKDNKGNIDTLSRSIKVD